jgi:hypothetical protein
MTHQYEGGRLWILSFPLVQEGVFMDRF